MLSSHFNTYRIKRCSSTLNWQVSGWRNANLSPSLDVKRERDLFRGSGVGLILLLKGL